MKKAAKMQAIQAMMDMLINEHGFIDPIAEGKGEEEEPDSEEEMEHEEGCDCDECTGKGEEGSIAEKGEDKPEDKPESIMSLVRIAADVPQKKNRYDDIEDDKKKKFGKSRYGRV